MSMFAPKAKKEEFDLESPPFMKQADDEGAIPNDDEHSVQVPLPGPWNGQTMQKLGKGSLGALEIFASVLKHFVSGMILQKPPNIPFLHPKHSYVDLL